MSTTLIKNTIDKLIGHQKLTVDEFELLISSNSDDLRKHLGVEADRVRRSVFGDLIYTRGLIEFTNYCKNDCYYCGIRCSNTNAERYRLTEEDILSCCESGYDLGFRTFVLQGGEDPYYNDDIMTSIIRKIRRNYPN